MRQMSISVIIPAYNATRFIRETVESVLQQTLPPDEVLVIDDGSTDDTASIAESFGPPVRVIRRHNVKLAATRNFGVQEARSEWVAFLDADDLWQSNKLERQMEELSRHPEADLCYTGRVLLLQELETTRLGKVVPVPPADEIRQALYRNTTFLPSSVMVRRSAFLAIGGHDTKFKSVEDWDTWLRLLHAGTKFAACPEPLMLYRIHSNSTSHNAIPALLEAKEIYRRHVLPQLPRNTRWIAHLKSQSGQEASAAFIMRSVKDPGYLSMMLLSILRYPFNEPHRYKGLLYMLYTRLKELTDKPPSRRHAN
jgi:glycosyltransferase involved in cell wall biosynthesis